MARRKRSEIVTKPECSGCPALCCKGLVMPIDRPRTAAAVEELKWHIQYDTVRIFILNRRWHLLVEGRCQYLAKDNLCRIYERRPERCRRHNPPDCERFGAFYDVLISTPEELDEHVARERRRLRDRRRAKAKRRAREG